MPRSADARLEERSIPRRPRAWHLEGVRRSTSRLSGEDALDELAVDVGEAEVAALVAEGQALVVEAEAVQDGSLEVVDVDFVFDDVEAEVVGRAPGDAGLDAAAGEPHG